MDRSLAVLNVDLRRLLGRSTQAICEDDVRSRVFGRILPIPLQRTATVSDSW